MTDPAPATPAGPLQRVGHGRWTEIMRPAIGILWVTDAGTIGFQPGPKMDPTPVTVLVENALAAGKDGNTAFDELLVAIGGPVPKAGDLEHWRVDRRKLELPIPERPAT